MPRYTSLQTFSDQSTKKVQLSSTTKGASSSSSSAPSSSSSSGSSSSAASTEDQVFNVRSSNAGASSSAFHVYRQARAREITRIGALEEDDRKQKEREELAGKVEANRIEAEERTKKNAEKRKKRKLAQQTAKEKSKAPRPEGDTKDDSEKKEASSQKED